MEQKFQFVRKSENEKTGPIPISNTASNSCPSACPLKNGKGCYAEAGYYTRLNWSKLDSGERGTSFDVFLDKVAALPVGQLWRHNVSGDLAGIGNKIDANKLEALTAANHGKKGFTYTHKPMTASNAAAVQQANENGFTVNLSANNAEHADQLEALNIAPVVVIVPENTDKVSYTPAGNKIVICPAQQRDDVTCASCGLCQRVDRSFIVGFRVHGARKGKIK